MQLANGQPAAAAATTAVDRRATDTVILYTVGEGSSKRVGRRERDKGNKIEESRKRVGRGDRDKGNKIEGSSVRMKY